VSRALDRAHSKYKHVYPIARIDLPFNQDNPSCTFSVVQVLMSRAEAEAEVSRLNQWNSGKGCVYLSIIARDYTSRLNRIPVRFNRTPGPWFSDFLAAAARLLFELGGSSPGAIYTFLSSSFWA
jgi:hypothetical protein